MHRPECFTTKISCYKNHNENKMLDWFFRKFIHYKQQSQVSASLLSFACVKFFNFSYQSSSCLSLCVGLITIKQIRRRYFFIEPVKSLKCRLYQGCSDLNF